MLKSDATLGVNAKAGVCIVRCYSHICICDICHYSAAPLVVKYAGTLLQGSHNDSFQRACEIGTGERASHLSLQVWCDLSFA